MYKTYSKFLQSRQVSPDWREAAEEARERRREAAATRRREAAEEANERRAPFFYSVKELSLGTKSDLPGWLPDYLQVEIREAGGTKGWIKKNAYWQKRLRRQYYSVIATKPELRHLKDFVPVWLFEEVCSFGRVHWLNVHAVKGRKKDPQTDHKEVKRESKYADLSHEERVGFYTIKNALDRAVSGGAFDMNHRRH